MKEPTYYTDYTNLTDSFITEENAKDATQAYRPQRTSTCRQHDVPTNNLFRFLVFRFKFGLLSQILPSYVLDNSLFVSVLLFLVLKKFPTAGSSSSSPGSTGTG